MTLTTPAGTPASSRIGISASMVSGVSDAGLSTTGAAGGERRADLARRHRGREIPRRHQHGDAGRLVMHECARPRPAPCTVGRDCARLLGVPAEELGGIGHLAARIRQRLAVLDGDQLRQPLGVAHDQLEGLAQDLAALARLLRGPGRESALAASSAALASSTVALATEAILFSVAGSITSKRRRRRICAICRRSRGRSAHWRADCRTWD
jgi:hypothetical protein